MYLKILIFAVTVHNWCSGAPLDSSARLKKLMSIDLSKLSNNNYKTLHGSPLYKLPTGAADNPQNSEPKSLNIDLSALNPRPSPTTAAPQDMDSQSTPAAEDYHNWNDWDDNDNRIIDTLDEYDYYQPLRLTPHDMYYNVWSPETPGYDALTDFLHEEYKTGQILANGKRDLYSSQDLMDNAIPIFPKQTAPCPYILPASYGISCEQLIQLFHRSTPYWQLRNGGHNKYKRDLFLSKGWGPSGQHINIASMFDTTPKASKVTQMRQLLANVAKSEANIINANQAIRVKQDHKQLKPYGHRWSVPHLFGTY
jgi:hypothetical protein